MSFQDYVYFRIYQYYQKKKDTPVMTGVYFVFVIQYCLIFFIGTIFNFLTDGWFSSKNMSKEVFWFIFFGTALILFVLDLVRYLSEKRRKEIEQRFRTSSLNKTLKLWQIFMIPIWIIALTFFVIFMFENGNPS